MARSYLEYLRLKAIVTTLRFFSGWTSPQLHLDESFKIKYRDRKRDIKVNVCKSLFYFIHIQEGLPRIYANPCPKA
jgi:hypothetical protein